MSGEAWEDFERTVEAVVIGYRLACKHTVAVPGAIEGMIGYPVYCNFCHDRAIAGDTARDIGRRGGLKGGPARAAALSPERRSEIASKAAKARWENRDDDRPR